MEITSLIDHVKTTTGTAITTEWGLSLHLKRNTSPCFLTWALQDISWTTPPLWALISTRLTLPCFLTATTTMAVVCGPLYR